MGRDPRREAKPKGKKSKNFLDSKDAALKLAESVAAIQEDSSLKKLERIHQTAQAVNTKAASKTTKETNSKNKLKQVKAALASKEIRAKREKAKLRKKVKSAKSDVANDKETKSGRGVGQKAPRKQVSFADD